MEADLNTNCHWGSVQNDSHKLNLDVTGQRPLTTPSDAPDVQFNDFPPLPLNLTITNEVRNP